MNKKIIVSILAIGLMLVSSGASINALSDYNQEFDMTNSIPQNVANSYTNLTVNETWDLLSDTTTIEVPIDVRRFDEWKPQRIDTPFPEHPRWYLLDLLQNATILPKFLEQYDGCDVVLYCKGGYRSFIATKILIDNNFTGKIYNMVGGITAWNTAGLPTTNGHVYNITVSETRELCNDVLNGKQKPIDVRRKDEWNEGFIDTPYPENPLWFILDDIKNDTKREKFKADHIGEEIICYCKGGYRSLLAAYELFFDNETFTGTIYNMLGGITSWNSSGYPFRNDNPPVVDIDGPIKVKKGKEVTYTFTTSDTDEDVFWLMINWGDGCPTIDWTGPYNYGELVKFNHTFEQKGTYNITAKAKDPYNESDWGSLEIQVPKSKVVNFNFNILEWFFEKFLKAFPILRQILG